MGAIRAGDGSTIDHDEVLRRCRDLVAVLGERAAEGEALRRVPEATITDVRDADLFRVIVPTSLGGHGLGLDSLAQGTRILAHGCPATAWTLSFLMLHAWLLTRFPATGRAEIFADSPSPFAPAPLAPTGSATPVDGGFRISGRWEWATGIAHADWVMVHAIQTDPVFATHFVLLRPDEVEVDDVWFTSGMRATGSNTVQVIDRFVPSSRTLPSTSLLFGAETLAGDGLAGHAVPPVLALVAAAPGARRRRSGGRPVPRAPGAAGAGLLARRPRQRPTRRAGPVGHRDQRPRIRSDPVGCGDRDAGRRRPGGRGGRAAPRRHPAGGRGDGARHRARSSARCARGRAPACTCPRRRCSACSETSRC